MKKFVCGVFVVAVLLSGVNAYLVGGETLDNNQDNNMSKQPTDSLALLEERARYLANHDPDFNNMTLRKYLEGFSPEERKKEIESLRSVGELPPINDGFFIETWQGVGYNVLRAGISIGSTIEEISGDTGVREYFEEAMSTRQHWRPDKNYTPLSLNPGNIGRTIGWLFFIIIACCIFFLIKKTHANLKKVKEQKAMRHLADDENKIFALQELDSGNIDKLTWAKALIAANGDEIKARAEYLKIRKKPAE